MVIASCAKRESTISVMEDSSFEIETKSTTMLSWHDYPVCVFLEYVCFHVDYSNARNYY